METKRPKHESARLALNIYESMYINGVGLGRIVNSVAKGEGNTLDSVAFGKLLDFLDLVACFRLDGTLAENHFGCLFRGVFEKLDRKRLEAFDERPNIKRLLK